MKKFEFTEEMLKEIKDLTAKNNHFEARFRISFIIAEKTDSFKSLCDAYSNLEALAELERITGVFNGNKELLKLRNNCDSVLKTAIKTTVINHEQVWSCL